MLPLILITVVLSSSSHFVEGGYGSSSSGQAHYEGSPSQSQSQGWGQEVRQEVQAQVQVKSSNHGWGQEPPIIQKPSSSGWSEKQPARPSSSGWGQEKPARPSGGGWNSGPSSSGGGEAVVNFYSFDPNRGQKEERRMEDSGWGSPSKPQENKGGWGQEKPSIPQRPPSTGWGQQQMARPERPQSTGWGQESPVRPQKPSSSGWRSSNDESSQRRPSSGREAWNWDVPSQGRDSRYPTSQRPAESGWKGSWGPVSKEPEDKGSGGWGSPNQGQRPQTRPSYPSREGWESRPQENNKGWGASKESRPVESGRGSWSSNQGQNPQTRPSYPPREPEGKGDGWSQSSRGGHSGMMDGKQNKNPWGQGRNVHISDQDTMTQLDPFYFQASPWPEDYSMTMMMKAFGMHDSDRGDRRPQSKGSDQGYGW